MKAPIEITKYHIGKAVYGYPTGNNARRGVDVQQLVEFQVVGFGRKYAKVVRFGHEQSICPKTGALQDQINSGYGGNAGFMFFESAADAEEYVNFVKLRESVAIELNFNSVKRLSDDLVVEIAKQLGVI